MKNLHLLILPIILAGSFCLPQINDNFFSLCRGEDAGTGTPDLRYIDWSEVQKNKTDGTKKKTDQSVEESPDEDNGTRADEDSADAEKEEGGKPFDRIWDAVQRG
jgi:hypothetical protein